jgi:outer membrane protein
MNKLLLVCLLVFAPISIASADLKIAVVDLNKAFDSYYKTKDDSVRLNEKVATYKKEVQDSMTDFQQMQDEAKKLYDAANDPTLSQAARDDKKKALDAKNQDLITLRNKIQEMETERSKELQEEQMRRRKEIVDEISKVVSDYSGPQGYDLVIDKSSLSALSGAPILLYNSSKLIDITADIVTLLNKTAPVGAGANSSGAAPAPLVPANH